MGGKHDAFALTRNRNINQTKGDPNWIFQDLTEPLDYSSLPNDLDTIIHLAQSESYRCFPEGAADIFDVNLHGTFKLLEYARKIGIRSFVFASTGSVYGYASHRFNETHPANPTNFYNSSKYAAEMLVSSYNDFFRTVVLRFFSVYGPGQKGMLIATLVRKVLNRETIVVEGKPGLRINPIYIEDALRVFEPVLHLREAGVFNVAGDDCVTITELVKLMQRLSGRRVPIRHTESNLRMDLMGDNTRMKKVLGVHPKVSLCEGLSRIIEVESARP
jgi:nucleoside-diphosphate-sugar epimerase